MTIEYRTGASGEIAGDERELFGLVTPFNTWTTIGNRDAGGFDERIAPGAFTKTLQERDVVLIDAHDTSQPMARTSVPEGQEGHLSLAQDPFAGLRARALPVQTTRAKDVLKLAKAQVIRGMSFGFEVIKDSWTDDEGRASDAYRGTRRTIHEIRLHEVTTTAFPAYPTTELSARDAMNTSHLLEQRAKFQEAQRVLEERTGLGLATTDLAATLVTFFNALPEDIRARVLGELRGSSISDLSTTDNTLSDLSTTVDDATDTEPASATPDDDERADLMLLAASHRYQMEI